MDARHQRPSVYGHRQRYAQTQPGSTRGDHQRLPGERFGNHTRGLGESKDVREIAALEPGLATEVRPESSLENFVGKCLEFWR